jgi:hypothetical protein
MVDMVVKIKFSINKYTYSQAFNESRSGLWRVGEVYNQGTNLVYS